MSKFISICIPSYNRPSELLRLLQSIDCEPEEVEIVICEDCAPKRLEVRDAVQKFRSNSKYEVRYIENETNCGYDKNLRNCINNATGDWIIYMGDDDMFIKSRLSPFIDFLKTLKKEKYVLRSYQAIHANGSVEKFQYFENIKYFEAGYDAYVTLFRKSVFISGFTFKRENAISTLTDRFDGTLLYQLYILAEICINYPSVYYNIPFTQSIDGGIPYFGNSASEKELYTPGTITVGNSVAFMKNFFVITQYIDKKYNMNSTSFIKKDISKYSYPILSIQRKKGRKDFKEYSRQLKEIGLNCSFYYEFYYCMLYIFGEGFCDWGIRTIKKILGRTPQL